MNIFLDTQVFESQNFNFKSRKFSSFHEHTSNDEINVYITKIVYEEIKKRIQKRIEIAKTGMLAIRKNVKILNNIDNFNDFTISNKYVEYEELLYRNLDEYIHKTNIQIIEYESIEIEEIFKAYFSASPPFNKTEKKHEFPDAFSLEIIRFWLNENNETGIIISADKDIPELIDTLSIPNLDHKDTIEDILDIIIPDKNLKRFLDNSHSYIKTNIKNDFSDEYIKVNEYDVEIKSGEIGDISLYDISVVNVDDGLGYAIVKCDLEINASISYRNPDGYHWDSDEREMVFFGEYESRDINDTFTTDIEIECELESLEDNDWCVSVLSYAIEMDINKYFQ